MLLPDAPADESGFGIGAVTSWLITMVTTPLGLTRARILRLMLVPVFEIVCLVNCDVPPTVTLLASPPFRR